MLMRLLPIRAAAGCIAAALALGRPSLPSQMLAAFDGGPARGAPGASSPPLSPLSLGGIIVGQPVLDSVRVYGAPDLVQTIDDGHEWRWYDAAGIDRDLLTDDALKVRRIMLSRPQRLPKRPAPALVQPPEAPVLDANSSGADRTMRDLGAKLLRTPPDYSAVVWRLGDGVVVAELQAGRVARLLGLDWEAATALGYLPGGTVATKHRPPVLLHLKALGYPRSAVDARAQGVVVLKVEIDSAGKVGAVSILVSSGHSDIDDAEVRTMQGSTFEPARCADVPCAGIYLDREEYEIDV
ncbi:MAG: energy transducer TonB [Candidatus Eremiobacteraeota bacterium]|nr:energy transducer TonB [Candidatus Eremiobacteraeota bacterium]